MKATLNENSYINNKQTFWINPGGSLRLLSCGEWNPERRKAELEDGTTRTLGISDPFTFDLEFDLADDGMLKLFQEWYAQGEDMGASVKEGSPTGIGLTAYRDITRVYLPLRDVMFGGKKYRAIGCQITAMPAPEYQMKGTDQVKQKVSITANSMVILDGLDMNAINSYR